MSKAVFLKNLKSKLNITDQIRIEKKQYDFGILRVITVGISFSVIIHPQDWVRIDNLKSGEGLFYKDEQNTMWDVKFDGENLSFKDINCHSCKVVVKKSEIL